MIERMRGVSALSGGGFGELAGIGLYYAWASLTLSRSKLFPGTLGEEPFDVPLRTLWSVVVVTLFFLVLVAPVPRRLLGSFRNVGFVLPMGCACSLVGGIVVGFCHDLGFPSGVYVVSAVAMSFGAFLLLLLWGKCFCCMETDLVVLHVLVSLVVASLVKVAVGMLEDDVARVLVLLCPIGSFALLGRCATRLRAVESVMPGESSPVVRRYVACLALIVFAFTAMKAQPVSGHYLMPSGVWASAVKILLPCAIFAAIAFVLKGSMASRFYRVMAFLLVAACMLVASGLFPLGIVGMQMVNEGLDLLDGMVWIVGAAVGVRVLGTEIPSYLIAVLVVQLSAFVGRWAGSLADELSLGDALTVVAGLLVVFIVLFVLRDRDIDAMVEIHDEAVAKSDSSCDDLCARLSERYGLTLREGEILELLARGRSAPFVSEELSLSLSTVKTHMRHIYAKIGVHSRQELLDVLEKGAADA